MGVNWFSLRSFNEFHNDQHCHVTSKSLKKIDIQCAGSRFCFLSLHNFFHQRERKKKVVKLVLIESILVLSMYIGGMFGIISESRNSFRDFFSWSFLPVLAWKTTEKNMGNFPRSLKNETKHWDNVNFPSRHAPILWKHTCFVTQHGAYRVSHSKVDKVNWP